MNDAGNNPARSVPVMLVSRNVFHVESALPAYFTFFRLIRSLVDPTLTAFIVCGPLQFALQIRDWTPYMICPIVA